MIVLYKPLVVPIQVVFFYLFLFNRDIIDITSIVYITIIDNVSNVVILSPPIYID